MCHGWFAGRYGVLKLIPRAARTRGTVMLRPPSMRTVQPCIAHVIMHDAPPVDRPSDSDLWQMSGKLGSTAANERLGTGRAHALTCSGACSAAKKLQDRQISSTIQKWAGATHPRGRSGFDTRPAAVLTADR